MARLIFHPPGRKLPPDHPFATPTIILGIERSASSQPDTPPLDMADPQWMKNTQDRIDQQIQQAWFPDAKPPAKIPPE